MIACRSRWNALPLSQVELAFLTRPVRGDRLPGMPTPTPARFGRPMGRQRLRRPPPVPPQLIASEASTMEIAIGDASVRVRGVIDVEGLVAVLSAVRRAS